MAFFWPLQKVLWRVRLVVVLWTDTALSDVELCNSIRFTCGLCVAFLINVLLARSVSFGGWPSLGRFSVVSCSFRLRMMDLMVLRVIAKDFYIFFITQPDLYFSITLSLACLESPLVFMV